LNGLVYTPAADYWGVDALTVTTQDDGLTGAGGILTDTDTVPITVSGLNDAPVVSGVTAAGVADADVD
jgi:VCBS repeat-containing protein